LGRWDARRCGRHRVFGHIGEWGAGLMSLGGVMGAIAAYLGNKSVDPEMYRYSRKGKDRIV